jgi:hypothetical protein
VEYGRSLFVLGKSRPVTPEVAGSSPVSPQRAASDLQSRVHHFNSGRGRTGISDRRGQEMASCTRNVAAARKETAEARAGPTELLGAPSNFGLIQTLNRDSSSKKKGY